jgi:hydroxymethylpyrimidine/phosphomethylpyrimidine kinase
MTAPPRALTIAGSDSGGGAGIQADLKTLQEFGVFGMSVVTALTAQNTLGVHDVWEAPPAFVVAQLDAVVTDIGVDATKTGMLASAEIIEVVAEGVRRHRLDRLVVDPVCASKHGDPLLHADAIDALRDQILPLAEIVTPNLGEVALLTGVKVHQVGDLRAAAVAVKNLGPRWVLIKGGHLPDNAAAVDLLSDGEQFIQIVSQRLETRDTHGTGCTLASAIVAGRAQGLDVEAAVRAAKIYVTGAIRHGLRLGGGIGPVNHAWRRPPEPA